MKHSRSVSAVMAAVCLLVMIFDSKTALTGASEGLQLCVATVIPALFPFFILSILLTGALSGIHIPLLGKLGQALGLPREGGFLLLVGLLGGYPVGAQCVAQSCQSGGLSRQDGERMLAFCSNAGPAFLFGIGSTLFPEKWMCWLLWGIHIAAALIVAALTPKVAPGTALRTAGEHCTLTSAMQRSVKAIAMVCGWIVLFRTIIAFFQRWFLWLLPSSSGLLVTGILELTNGCCDLDKISSVGLRMQLFSLFLGFGGLCVLLQTYGVLSGSGLRGTAYFPGKIAQAAISYLLCVLAQPLLPEEMRHFPAVYLPLAALVICIAYRIYRLKLQKYSSIPAGVGV